MDAPGHTQNDKSRWPTSVLAAGTLALLAACGTPDSQPGANEKSGPEACVVTIAEQAAPPTLEGSITIPSASAATESRTKPPQVVETPKYPPRAIDTGLLMRRIAGYSYTETPAPKRTVLAAITCQDGKLAISEQAPNLLPGDLDALESIVGQNEPWIIAATKSRTLDKVEFAVEPGLGDHEVDGYPHYKSESTGENGSPIDVVAYDLPARGSYNVQTMTVMARHEFNHALVQNLGLVDRSATGVLDSEVVPIDMQKYSELCNSIRDIAVTQTLSRMQSKLALQFDKTANLLDAERGAVFREVANAMRNGTFGDYQAQQGESQDIWESVVQSCKVDDPWQVAVRELKKRGLALPSTEEYDVFDSALQATDDWEIALSDHSIYRVLRENTYFAPGTVHGQMLGHPYDSANELMASYMNVAVSFPDELRANMARLPKDQQQVLRDLLTLLSDDMTRIHGDSPELVQIIQENVDKVLA